MGLLGECYNAFSLGYTIAVIKLNDDYSRADKVLIGASAAFLVLSIGDFFIQLHDIPCGYKWRFTGKSLLRGLLAPLLSLLYYPILLGCSNCVKRALTFSNEAHDGVEWTRQLKIFELVDSELDPHRYLATTDLNKENGKWGYDRLVGGLWVRVRFEELNMKNFVQTLKLRTSCDGETTFIKDEDIPALQTVNDSIQGEEQRNKNDSSVKVPVNVSSLEECMWVNLEKGSNLTTSGASGTSGVSGTSGASGTSGTSEPPAPQYKVTITCKRVTYCKWNLKCKVNQTWTLFQIHQYMLCLDVWGNHPKQGIWKPHEPTCCSGDTSCSNVFTRIKRTCCNNQPFRYCYRHEELIVAIGNNKRIKERPNYGTWYTVV